MSDKILDDALTAHKLDKSLLVAVYQERAELRASLAAEQQAREKAEAELNRIEPEYIKLLDESIAGHPERVKMILKLQMAENERDALREQLEKTDVDRKAAWRSVDADNSPSVAYEDGYQEGQKQSKAALWKRCAKYMRETAVGLNCRLRNQTTHTTNAESALSTREAQLREMCGHVLRMFDLDDIYYMKAKARAILKELES